MPAFLAYSGTYDFDGQAYEWRCFATQRIHAVRRADHGPLPVAGENRKWLAPAQPDYEVPVLCLVHESVNEVSQILLQVKSVGDAAIEAVREPREMALSA